MPWRKTRDPYRILISEMMLQQTQVATAMNYYERFCARFPTVNELAAARSDEVMKLWEGLGYYARARNLHRAAQEVVSRFDGKIPDSLDDLLTLPGVGLYTAGALLSIAFDNPAPVLDGNVMRVFARVFRMTENIDLVSVRKRMWRTAEEMLPKKNVRDYNQALMELGAVICRPKKPQCSSCPVVRLCKAATFRIQEELPVRSPRKIVPHYNVTAGIIWKGNRFLITLRPPRGLLGGLWEFPGGKQEKGETLEDCLEREIREELGISILVCKHVVSVRHAYTHFKITLHAFYCRYIGGAVRLRGCDDCRWITPEELDQYAFPGADRKIIEGMKRKMNIS